MNPVCLLLAQLATSGLDAGEASFAKGPYAQGRIDPVIAVSRRKVTNDLQDDGKDGRWTRLRRGRVVQGIDCQRELVDASVALTQEAAVGGDIERPEEIARIKFLPVVVAKDGGLALLRWRYYYHPLNAGGHFAVMENDAGRWTIVQHGRDGPIS